MTKYIVKNCPCLEDHTQNCWDSHIPNEISCKDRTDCPIKQVVEMCKKEIDNCRCCKDRQTLQKQELSCGDCIHLGRRGLSKQILQTLQVEEVE